MSEPNQEMDRTAPSTEEASAAQVSPAAKRARAIRTGLIAVVAIVAVVLVIKYTRHHIFPKRFAVVEEGKIYRSGELERGPMERVVDEHEIRTILTLLTDLPDAREQQIEREVAEREGIEIIRIPMPGDGCAEYDDIRRAASILADESKWPILVHCAAGVHRTGVSVATYRIMYQGWDFDRAMQEAIDRGYRAHSAPAMMEHMRDFYETRLKPELETAPSEP